MLDSFLPNFPFTLKLPKAVLTELEDRKFVDLSKNGMFYAHNSREYAIESVVLEDKKSRLPISTNDVDLIRLVFVIFLIDTKMVPDLYSFLLFTMLFIV